MGGRTQRALSLRPARVAAQSGDTAISQTSPASRAAVSVAPPFRAHAVRRDGTTWAVAARRIETAELDDDPAGNEIEIAWDGAERSVRIDGEPTLRGVPALERLAAARHSTYVVTAARLAGEVWEIAVSPL